MKSIVRAIVLGTAVCFAIGTPLEGAGTVTVQFDPGTVVTIPTVVGYQPDGSTMAGMKVSAYLADGTSGSVFWSSFGGQSGGAVGTGWSITETGDTWSNNWALQNNTGQGLLRFTIDGLPGSIVFDTTHGTDTPGSASGLNFSVVSGLGINDIVATYKNACALPGQLPLEDIYGLLDVQFTNPGGFASGQILTFKADTDVVPEPGTAALLMLSGATILRRRRWGVHPQRKGVKQ